MPNKLASEISPYLLQHADNPVDWYPWGEEAFERARSEDKPVFLSIGYAACHWCHVMAHESFEDQETAAYMNDNFINIKVDREERPDVDTIYMDAVVALTGHGGWPLSAFLTPEGEPFYAGTYFPPQRRFNMPSFREVLEHIQDEWVMNRERIELIGAELSDRLQATPALDSGSAALDSEVPTSAAKVLFERYDWKHGGWGGAPKFPQASPIEFLLQRYFHQEDRLALDMATHALRSMSRGGLFDQLGGGFHRYAVDENWLVPHFEKMLYDNAILLPVYLHAWQITGEDEFLEVVEKTWRFLFREMRHEEGGFYASLDADSEGEEGKYYVWTADEMSELISDPETYDFAMDLFGLRAGPNFEGANVLHRPIGPDDVAEQNGLSRQEFTSRIQAVEAELLQAREARIRPATDDKMITAWNGLLLIALAETARVLGDEKYLTAADELGEFLVNNLKSTGVWKRSWRAGVARHNATLRDLASVGLGLLALYETTFMPRWYQEAEFAVTTILESYRDPEGGFFDTRDDQDDLIARPKSMQDTPIPSGNSLAVHLLLRMYALTGKSEYAEPAEFAVRSMQTIASRHPTAFAAWLTAQNSLLSTNLQLAFLGSKNSPELDALRETVNSRYLPNLVTAGSEPGERDHPPLMADRPLVGGKPSAYLCQGFVCNRPTNSPEDLTAQIDRALST